MLSNASITQMRDCWEPWNLYRFSEKIKRPWAVKRFYVDSWTFFPALMISYDYLYETISLMEYLLLLVWIPSHTWPFRNSVQNLGVGFFLQTVQSLTFPWLDFFVFAPGFAFRGAKKTPPSVALRFRWGVSTENHHRRYQWILAGKEWKLLGVGKILPSRELTYPPKMAFWRWFSFSQGGIC